MVKMETGKLVVARVDGKSTVTRCFSQYPLKFIVPTKAGRSEADAVWIYALTYGGGIVSGDCISFDLTIDDGCTAVLTTQASTKVYKSVALKCSKQTMEARIGNDALMVVIPDPVTCFSTARYSQKQVFRIVSGSSLLLVDWITSGRHESGEKWDFGLYKSTNHIYLESKPLFLDTVLLEHESATSIAERMQCYQVIAMVILLGPKLKHIQDQVQEDVKKMMMEQLHMPSRTKACNSDRYTKPSLIASCNPFGPKGVGVVIRIAATTTESVYRFLQHQLAGLEPMLGLCPYQ
ncbi:urease accessory protein D [Cynara cardunculus var. scolymus]|uniref:urease accessory protein D n=1 Tax=Cynara cardunculus var. scolymus TaxID=59895 RepID=UPI000D62784D|nr:urease accessory protein D [Cynara cardunculus var. scolymus]